MMIGPSGSPTMDRTSGAILLLIGTLAIHLVEEVATGFRERFPLGEMPRRMFVGINVLLYAFCFATFFLSLRGAALVVPLAWAFAVAMLLNGVGHVGIVLVRRRYFPGAVTGLGLILAAGYLIGVLTVRS